MFRYKKSADLSLPVGDIFKFYTNTYNICKMLPDYINVKVLEGGEDLKSGDRVKLKVRMAGISFLWESVVEDYIENEYFSDRMLKGPFKSWEHKHYFKKTECGTHITDVIYYDVPFGLLGIIADTIFVRNTINNIFTIRHNFDINSCRF